MKCDILHSMKQDLVTWAKTLKAPTTIYYCDHIITSATSTNINLNLYVLDICVMWLCCFVALFGHCCVNFLYFCEISSDIMLNLLRYCCVPTIDSRLTSCTQLQLPNTDGADDSQWRRKLHEDLVHVYRYWIFWMIF